MDTTTIAMGKILIIGDSWGCGEWSLSKEVVHEGTKHYLQEAGYKITSIAEGSSSNAEQISKLNDHKDADICIWFLTDPLREVDRQPTTLEQYHHTRRTLLERSFEHVDALLPNTEIWLIGGVCQVPEWLATQYPRWKIVVKDLRAWLLSEDNHIDTLCRDWQYPDCDVALLGYHELQEKIIARHRIRAERGIDTKEHRLFWPDTVHPNRLGHHKLTEELLLPMLKEAKA